MMSFSVSVMKLVSASIWLKKNSKVVHLELLHKTTSFLSGSLQTVNSVATFERRLKWVCMSSFIMAQRYILAYLVPSNDVEDG